MANGIASKTTLPTLSASEVSRVISRRHTRTANAHARPTATTSTPSTAASRQLVSRASRKPDVRARSVTTSRERPRAPSIQRGSTHEPYHQTSIV